MWYSIIIFFNLTFWVDAQWLVYSGVFRLRLIKSTGFNGLSRFFACTFCTSVRRSHWLVGRSDGAATGVDAFMSFCRIIIIGCGLPGNPSDGSLMQELQTPRDRTPNLSIHVNLSGEFLQPLLLLLEFLLSHFINWLTSPAEIWTLGRPSTPPPTAWSCICELFQ